MASFGCVVVLSLFWSLVHCQTFPYISFMGQTLANHSYVDLSRVGNAGDNSDGVQCHTDLSTCCSDTEGIHRGDWYFPNGTRLPFVSNANTPVGEARDAQRVNIRRSTATGPAGIYHCDIPIEALHDDMDISVRDTVYLGLYTITGGIPISVLSFVNGSFTGDVMISGDITVHSDLNGPSPQFTLTCISTGGPATTVTWTRDSTTVTEGTETVFDNAMTAQYTHTLTETGRIGGLYTCNVSNNKPSSASASIALQGSLNSYNANCYALPSSLVFSGAVTATTVTVTGNVLGSSTVTGFMVEWQRDTSVACSDVNQGTMSATGPFTSYTIAGLEPGNNYLITVRMYNAFGSAQVTLSAMTETVGEGEGGRKIGRPIKLPFLPQLPLVTQGQSGEVLSHHTASQSTGKR